jgi:hypothetical protein
MNEVICTLGYQADEEDDTVGVGGLFGIHPVLTMMIGFFLLFLEYLLYEFGRPLIAYILDPLPNFVPSNYVSQLANAIASVGLNFDDGMLILFIGTLVVFVFLPAAELF